MSEKKRRIVTTIEKHERWIVRRPVEESAAILCGVCSNNVSMLTLREAADQAGVSPRTVYQWADEGRVHSTETPEGGLLVCLAPLTFDVERGFGLPAYSDFEEGKRRK